jgi:hypothetical protein
VTCTQNEPIYIVLGVYLAGVLVENSCGGSVFFYLFESSFECGKKVLMQCCFHQESVSGYLEEIVNIRVW